VDPGNTPPLKTILSRVDDNVWIDRLAPARPCPIREALHRSVTAAAAVEGGLLPDPALRISKKAPSAKRP